MYKILTILVIFKLIHHLLDTQKFSKTAP